MLRKSRNGNPSSLNKHLEGDSGIDLAIRPTMFAERKPTLPKSLPHSMNPIFRLKPARLASVLPIASLAFGSFFFSSARAGLPSNAPFLIDFSKENPKSASQRADAFMKKNVITLLDRKTPSPTGNPHDYFSYARYAWPNPKTPPVSPTFFKTVTPIRNKWTREIPSIWGL